MTALGRAAQGNFKEKNAIKKIDRLLGNEHLWQELPIIYKAVAEQMLGWDFVGRVQRKVQFLDETDGAKWKPVGHLHARAEKYFNAGIDRQQGPLPIALRGAIRHLLNREDEAEADFCLARNVAERDTERPVDSSVLAAVYKGDIEPAYRLCNVHFGWNM